MKGKNFRITSFLLPGFNHVICKHYCMGFFFLFLSLATVCSALGINRAFFLQYLWKLKGLTLPHTLIEDFYNDKQEALYNFLYVYLILGAGAFLDLAFSKNHLSQTKEHPGG